MASNERIESSTVEVSSHAAAIGEAAGRVDEGRRRCQNATVPAEAFAPAGRTLTAHLRATQDTVGAMLRAAADAVRDSSAGLRSTARIADNREQVIASAFGSPTVDVRYPTLNVRGDEA